VQTLVGTQQMNKQDLIPDLLHRGHESEMEAQIIGVLSNHDKLKKLASWYLFNIAITLKNKLTHFGDQTMCIRARNE
jgi:formyltetrahydrofolate hydrolase